MNNSQYQCFIQMYFQIKGVFLIFIFQNTKSKSQPGLFITYMILTDCRRIFNNEHRVKRIFIELGKSHIVVLLFNMFIRKIVAYFPCFLLFGTYMSMYHMEGKIAIPVQAYSLVHTAVNPFPSTRTGADIGFSLCNRVPCEN